MIADVCGGPAGVEVSNRSASHAARSESVSDAGLDDPESALPRIHGHVTNHGGHEPEFRPWCGDRPNDAPAGVMEDQLVIPGVPGSHVGTSPAVAGKGHPVRAKEDGVFHPTEGDHRFEQNLTFEA